MTASTKNHTGEKSSCNPHFREKEYKKPAPAETKIVVAKNQIRPFSTPNLKIKGYVSPE